MIHTARGRDRGIALPLVALSIAVLIVSTAFAVDIGRVSLARRDLQADADAVALDMARLIDGRTAAQIEADPAYWDALAASAERNHFAVSDLTPTLGCYDQASDTFDTGCPVPDAVQIEASGSIDYYFQPGGSTTMRLAIGQRADTEEAWFRVGSFLLGVNPASDSVVGQILNQVIPGASALSYQGVASATVTIDELALAMGVGSPEAVLQTELTMDELLVIAAAALAIHDPGDTATIDLLNHMATLATAVGPFRVGDIIGVDTTGGTPAGSTEINLLQLLTSTAFLADGNHAVTVPGTTLGIPGVGDVGVELTVIEGPQRGGPDDGATATTGQVRMTITPQLDFSVAQVTYNLCNLPIPGRNLLNSLLGGLLDFALCTLLLPVNELVGLELSAAPTIDLFAAGATVTQDIDCANSQLHLNTDPIPLELLAPIDIRAAVRVGTTPIDLINAHIDAAATAYGTALPETFDYPADFGPANTRRVGSANMGLGGLVNASVTTFQVLETELAVLANLFMAPLMDFVNDTLALIDQGLIGPLVETLGLSIAGADLTAESMNCDREGVALVK